MPLIILDRQEIIASPIDDFCAISVLPSSAIVYDIRVCNCPGREDLNKKEY